MISYGELIPETRETLLGSFTEETKKIVTVIDGHTNLA